VSIGKKAFFRRGGRKVLVRANMLPPQTGVIFAPDRCKDIVYRVDKLLKPIFCCVREHQVFAVVRIGGNQRACAVVRLVQSWKGGVG